MNLQGKQAVDHIKGLGEEKGINVESILLEGNPSEELIRYADEEKKWISLLWAVSERQDSTGYFWTALQEI